MSVIKKHLLVVGGIREVHDALVNLGCEITWFVKKNTVIPGDQSRICKNIFMFDPNSTATALAEVARAICAGSLFDGVCAFHDEAQMLALELANALDLPFAYSKSEIENTRNKFHMREALRRSSLCTSQSAVVQTIDQAKQFYRSSTNKHCIVKPVDGTGSSGVFQVEERNVSLLDTVAYPVLMEEFFSGQEFSVEGFTHQGEHHICAITEKFKTSDGFMEKGHLVPARIADDQRVRIENYVSSCLTALGVSAGLTHTEIIINDQEVFFIETHTRAAGDQIPKLVKLATGIDLYHLCALQAIGAPITKEALSASLDASRSACIEYLVQSPSDKPIRSIENVEKVRAWQNVEDVYFRYKVGERLPPVQHSFDRAASAMVVGSSPEKALALAEEALQSIKIHCD